MKECTLISTFDNWLLHLQCVDEHCLRFFLPAAVGLPCVFLHGITHSLLYCISPPKLDIVIINMFFFSMFLFLDSFCCSVFVFCCNFALLLWCLSSFKLFTEAYSGANKYATCQFFFIKHTLCKHTLCLFT